MSPDLVHGIDLLVLTIGYWLVDRAIREEGLVRLASRGLGSARASIAVLTLAAVALGAVWSWRSVPDFEAVRALAVAISAALAWKAATKDIDIVIGEAHLPERIVLVLAVAGAWLSPAFVLVAALLLTSPFGLWEHHSTLPMRVLQAIVAYLVLASAAGASIPWVAGQPGILGSSVALVFLVLTIQISHYLITALAKGWLGPRWYSWVTDNQLHHLAASAYSWGWARFLSWPTWKRVIAAARAFERPAQLFAFAVELLSPLALLHPYVAIGFCLSWSAFHVGVFSLSGLLFWDWILTNLSIAMAIALLPSSVTASVFGPGSVVLSLVFMVAFPLRHKLWKPMPLGWWDTPFTQRIHWQAHGQSGQVYGVYNDLMCPHERLYGKVHACFLAPVPVMTYHLGEVWKRELRDALRDAGPDVARLDRVRERYGIQPRDASMAERHVAYLRRFFVRLNRRARKSVLPRWLRWLKAPGDQIFYWGELPAYRGQEAIAKVTLRYREEYFDGEDLRRLRDEPILSIDIDEAADAASTCVPEPTPKEIDDLLLRHAAGKLLDLPKLADGYVRADDGARRPRPS